MKLKTSGLINFKSSVSAPTESVNPKIVELIPPNSSMFTLFTLIFCCDEINSALSERVDTAFEDATFPMERREVSMSVVATLIRVVIDPFGIISLSADIPSL